MYSNRETPWKHHETPYLSYTPYLVPIDPRSARTTGRMWWLRVSQTSRTNEADRDSKWIPDTLEQGVECWVWSSLSLLGVESGLVFAVSVGMFWLFCCSF